MLVPFRRSNSLPFLALLQASLVAPFFCLSAPGPQEPTVAVSVPELKARADSGDSSARFQLGQFLLTANPGAPGFESAVTWLRSVADNNPYYEFLFGYLHEQGRGVPQDYSTAARYYEAACLQGYAPAQNNLASLYLHGLGVKKDLSKAFELYLASARQADPIARYNLALMYYKGYGVVRDDSEAARWFQSAADQGEPAAEYYLGFFYFKGIGVPLDYNSAAHWITLAAEKGHAAAMHDLASLYERGIGLPLDYVSAYAWYSRAATAGDASSVDRLKGLSQIMTRRQIDQATSLVSERSIAPRRDSDLSPTSLSFLPKP
jgi:TPR repeat protein